VFALRHCTGVNALVLVVLSLAALGLGAGIGPAAAGEVAYPLVVKDRMDGLDTARQATENARKAATRDRIADNVEKAVEACGTLNKTTKAGAGAANALKSLARALSGLKARGVKAPRLATLAGDLERKAADLDRALTDAQKAWAGLTRDDWTDVSPEDEAATEKHYTAAITTASAVLAGAHAALKQLEGAAGFATIVAGALDHSLGSIETSAERLRVGMATRPYPPGAFLGFGASLASLKAQAEYLPAMKTTWDGLGQTLKDIEIGDVLECDRWGRHLTVSIRATKASFGSLSAFSDAFLAYCAAEAEEVHAVRRQLQDDPQHRTTAAVEADRAGRELLQVLETVCARLTELSRLSGLMSFGTGVTALGEILNGYETPRRLLAGALLLLREGLGGDYAGFVARTARLYYFSDVQVLVKMLNPDAQRLRGSTDAATIAAQRRDELATAELDVWDAYTLIDRAKARLEKAQTAANTAKAAADAAAARANALARRTASLQSRVSDSANTTTDTTSESPSTATSTTTTADTAPTGTNSTEKPTTDTTPTGTNSTEKTTTDTTPSGTGSTEKTTTDAATTKAKATTAAEAELQEHLEVLKAEKTQADEALTEAKSEQATAKAVLLEAQTNLDDKQTALMTCTKQAYVAALVESDAFAAAHQDAPFWFATPETTTSNPARRVILCACEGQNVIYLRGTPADVEYVRKIIAEMDRPAPQARLTLWTLEIGGGPTDIDNAMAGVRRQLGVISENSGAFLAALRWAVSRKANELEAHERRNWPRMPPWFRRLFVYAPEVREELGLTERSFERLKSDPASAEFLRRAFPDPAAVTTLGEAILVLCLSDREYQLEILDAVEGDLRVRLGPPGETEGQGAETTRLRCLRQSLGLSANAALSNEAEVRAEQWATICALKRAAALDNEIEARRRVESCLARSLRADVTLWGDGGKSALDPTGLVAELERVHRGEPRAEGAGDILNAAGRRRAEPTWRGVIERYATVTDRPGPWGGITPAQHELIAALKRPALQNALDTVQRRGRDLEGHEMGGGAHPGAEYREGERDGLPEPAKSARTAIGTARVYLEQEGLLQTGEAPAANGRQGPPSPRAPQAVDGPLDPATAAADVGQRLPSPQAPQVVDAPLDPETAASVARLLERTYPLERTAARTAAANQMLKEFMIAVEDDVDREVVTPAINQLQEGLRRTRLRVGILQHTSVLASNRRIARVSPHATAELGLEGARDILNETLQLTQIYLAFQTGGVSALLGASPGLPKEAPPSIYAVTAGNTFQVTPFVDPSGQALRFAFDYVAQTPIREPDGTVDPRLPRVQRHTVNTEVQLSNLELRDISEYSANFQVGTPRRLSGGIPILRDLPVLREIPIIGWFQKTDSRDAVAVHSLIFAQTTVYPTIEDMVNLLATPVPDPDDLL